MKTFNRCQKSADGKVVFIDMWHIRLMSAHIWSEYTLSKRSHTDPFSMGRYSMRSGSVRLLFWVCQLVHLSAIQYVAYAKLQWQICYWSALALVKLLWFIKFIDASASHKIDGNSCNLIGLVATYSIPHSIANEWHWPVVQICLSLQKW